MAQNRSHPQPVTRSQRIVNYVHIAYANSGERLLRNGNTAHSARALVGLGTHDLAALSDVSERTIQRIAHGSNAKPETLQKLEDALGSLDRRIAANFMNAANILDSKRGADYRRLAARYQTDQAYASTRLGARRTDWQKRIKNADSGVSNSWLGTISA